jgi:aminoglycoside phosphotransferase (APT) family kinase protein
MRSNDRLIGRHQDGIGGPVEDLPWYIAFGHFKLAAIVQTFRARYQQGLAIGPEFESASLAVLAARRWTPGRRT